MISEESVTTLNITISFVWWVLGKIIIYEKVSGELNVEMFLNQISKEVGIRGIKIFNNNENG